MLRAQHLVAYLVVVVVEIAVGVVVVVVVVVKEMMWSCCVESCGGDVGCMISFPLQGLRCWWLLRLV